MPDKAKLKVPLAIAYDFDGTLAPGNMQEHSFIPQVGMSKKAFWAEVKQLARKQKGDETLIYMGHMLDKARAKEVRIRKSDFKKHGAALKLFPGVEEWFDRINEFGQTSCVDVQHFIISSGIREMIVGTPIWKNFRAIFASSFWYDQHSVAKWPALALNYTSKTQYLFRINKGSLDVFDHSKINRFVPKPQRPVPFENMIFIGDGETDIPCFRLVKDQGGHSIAVYNSHVPKARDKADQLLVDGRVHFVAQADYRDNHALDRIVKAIIEKLQIDTRLARFGKTKSED